jgi:hypothetical protein
MGFTRKLSHFLSSAGKFGEERKTKRIHSFIVFNKCFHGIKGVSCNSQVLTEE